MLTIDKTPPLIAFAGNPIRYKVNTNNFLSSAGTAAEFVLRVSGVDTTVGHTFNISFADKDLDFELVADPSVTDDPLCLPTAAGGDTYSTWAAKLFAAFLQCYDLQYLFFIELGTDQGTYRDITFTGFEADADLTITFTNEDVVGVAEQANTPGVDPVYRDGFGILMDLWKDTYGFIGEDFKSVDADGDAIFDIREYLQGYLDTITTGRFGFPLENLVQCIARTYVKPYLASFAERFGDEVMKMHYDDVRYAIGGGLNREALAYYNGLDTSYFEQVENLKRFLSWAPLIKKTTKAAPEKLFFLFPDTDDYSQYQLMIKIYFTNNSVYTDNLTELASYTPYTVLECTVGYTYLDLDTLGEGHEIDAWEIWLRDENEVDISEVRRFVLDKRTYENERYFIFRNSFSAYDVLRCTGVQQGEIGLELVPGTAIDEDEETLLNAPVRQFSAMESQAFKTNTGFITREEKDWIRDFFLSKEIYEIVDNTLCPIVITSKKQPMFTDKETLYSQEFEYIRAYTDDFYSPGQESASY